MAEIRVIPSFEEASLGYEHYNTVMKKMLDIEAAFCVLSLFH